MTSRRQLTEGADGRPRVEDPRLVSRRNFFRLVGGAAVTAAGATLLDRSLLSGGHGRSTPLRPVDFHRTIKYLQLVATDGWVSMPDAADPSPPFWPDPFVPAGRRANLYIFGFADATSATPLTWDQLLNNPRPSTSPGVTIPTFKNYANLSAPILYFDEGDDVRLTLWNLGLAQRPDLLDAHTVHWHGFPNQIPYFDGVPQASLAVPVGRNLGYRFILDNQYLPVADQQQIAGTYMYHCHVEDVEHVHMGLTGVIFIRPKLNKDPAMISQYGAGAKFAYNEPSTRYDREFAFILTEADVRDHWNDAHKQENDFTQWTPKFSLMNGRAHPDTLDGNGPQVPGFQTSDARLSAQPWSSLIQANAGETVLLRFSNLGFQEHSMELPGLPLRVIGKDAKQLTGARPGYIGGTRADLSYTTYRVELGPGESRDVLFQAPSDVSIPSGRNYATYDFFDRNYQMVKKAGNGAGTYGGMRTEVRVYKKGALPAQNVPQQLFVV